MRLQPGRRESGAGLPHPPDREDIKNGTEFA
ncbi:hypothetical protein FHS81_002851 [Pseudochelatococcus contaminans]|uniref:Uncharacterized protein n=1 Tax=Pseudochelatococcus contaminans TaxID=1538103 RepID=A0A7W5Z5W5_9HYPH|nr:hypothetical protein [Pseudochelatococcus contaminans]